MRKLRRGTKSLSLSPPPSEVVLQLFSSSWYEARRSRPVTSGRRVVGLARELRTPELTAARQDVLDVPREAVYLDRLVGSDLGDVPQLVLRGAATARRLYPDSVTNAKGVREPVQIETRRSDGVNARQTLLIAVNSVRWARRGGHIILRRDVVPIDSLLDGALLSRRNPFHGPVTSLRDSVP